MNEERLYDYSKGLNAPYWIQEIKTKRALDYGTLRHLCSCPFSLFYHRLCGHVTLWRIYLCATRKNHSLNFSLALLVYSL